MTLVVGRILKVHAAARGDALDVDTAIESPTNGYAATREAAMASFAESWQREKWNLWHVQVSCRARSVSAQLNFVGTNLRPDAVAAPHGRTLGQGCGNPPIRRTLGIDKDARLRL